MTNRSSNKQTDQLTQPPAEMRERIKKKFMLQIQKNSFHDGYVITQSAFIVYLRETFIAEPPSSESFGSTKPILVNGELIALFVLHFSSSIWIIIHSISINGVDVWHSKGLFVFVQVVSKVRERLRTIYYTHLTE